MNRLDTISGVEASLLYGDGDFSVMRPGSYVLCAVTGARIALDELRYWSVEYQEAYASPEISLKRYLERNPRAPKT